MALAWKVVINDRTRNPGQVYAQVMTDPSILGVDMERSTFPTTDSAKPASAKMFLSFAAQTPNLNIREGMEVWAGWCDDATGVWSDTPTPPWGGYILKIPTEGLVGNEKKFECDLIDYGYDVATCPVLGWPTSEINPPVFGFPPGYSVAQWLRGGGGAPYPGVIPAHMKDVLLDGIDPIFDRIILSADVIPGNSGPGAGQDSGVPGQFGFIMLDKVVTAISDACNFAYVKHYLPGPLLTTTWWMSAGANGQVVSPRFMMRNSADQLGAPKWTVVAGMQVNPGEIEAMQPFKHDLDLSVAQQRVVVKGVGGDPTLPNLPLVFYDYSDPAHLAQYPTPYFVTPGRTKDVLIETRLHTLALAQQLATYVEWQTWGPIGAIEFHVDEPGFKEGDLVRYRDLNEAIDQVLPVTLVEPQSSPGGHPIYKIRIGFTPLNMANVLKGGLPDVLLMQQDLQFQTGNLVQRTLPGHSAQIPPEIAPTHPERNKIVPRYTDTPAMVVKASKRIRLDDQGNPIPPPAGGWPHTFQAQGKDGITRTSAGPDGEPHGHVLSFNFDPTGSQLTAGLAVVSAMTLIRQRLLAAGGLATLATVAYKVNGATKTFPFTVVDGDVLEVTLTPNAETLICYLTVTEIAVVTP